MTSILKVDSIQNAAGTAAMTIDSSGRILQPARPAFHVHKNGTQQSLGSSTSAVEVTWSNAVLDVGNHFDFSDNSYVVPVTGNYFIQCSIKLNFSGSAGKYWSHTLRADDTQLFQFQQLQTSATNGLGNSVNGGSTVYPFTAGQRLTVTVNVSEIDCIIDGVALQTYFSGYLIG